MSKYIPHAAVTRETNMQIVRRQRGLKTGAYVKFPDPDEGPLVVLASFAERLKKLPEYAAYLEAKAREEKKKEEGEQK